MHPKIDLKQLPPLKALKGFEAATRHQSIRDAADELCLTHPAVSHQVQLIEDALGVTLFVQEGRHIVSTEEGKVLYPYVRAAFESLLEGVEEVHRHALDKPLRVQTYVTASIRWLAKRVPQFLADHPEVKLTLNTCAVEWEFDDVHADVGLVYCASEPDATKFHWVPLYEYALFPVCSPAVAEAMGPNPSPQTLMTKPLVAIYTEVQNWETWFASAGSAFEPSVPYLMVDTLAIWSAMNGCPPKPGSTVMTRTMSTNGSRSAIASADVPGFTATPLRAPAARISRATRIGSDAASTWNVTL